MYAVRSTSRREAHRHPGAVGRPAARGGDDRLEAGLALAGDAGLDELDLGVGEQDRLGLDRPVEHGLATRRRRAARP